MSQERKQSFSCERPKSSSSKHNNREHKPKYLIERDPDFKGNFYKRYNHYENDKQYLEYAKEIYLKKHGQKMQKIQSDTGMLWEAAITLKKEHGEKEVLDLFKTLKTKYGGHEVLEVSIHHDEGHFVDEGGLTYYPNEHIFYREESKSWYLDRKFKEPAPAMEIVYNYHAHVKFSMMEQESCKTPQMAKKDWMKRHEVVANELGLRYEPGKTRHVKKSVNQVKAEHHENRGQNVKEAKLTRKNDKLKETVKSLESKLEAKGKVSQADLRGLKEEYRKEMISSELYYTPEDYQALNKLFKDATADNKAKSLDIKALESKVELLSKDKTAYKAKAEELQTSLDNAEVKLKAKDAQIVDLKSKVYSDQTYRARNALNRPVTRKRTWEQVAEKKDAQIVKLKSKVKSQGKVIGRVEKARKALQRGFKSLKIDMHALTAKKDKYIADIISYGKKEISGLKAKVKSLEVSHTKKQPTELFKQVEDMKQRTERSKELIEEQAKLKGHHLEDLAKEPDRGRGGHQR